METSLQKPKHNLDSKKRPLSLTTDDTAGTMSGESKPPPTKKVRMEDSTTQPPQSNTSSDDSSNQRNSSDDGMEISKEEKKKRKRADRRPKTGAFIHFEGFPDEQLQEILSQVDDAETQKEYPGAKARIIPNELLRIHPSPEDTKRERKAYRKQYNNLPENITKRKEKSKRPEEQAKRKMNNEDQATKERKKACAFARRKTLQEFKERYGNEYESTIGKYIAPLPKRDRKPRAKCSLKTCTPEKPTMLYAPMD
jgi:hypothetical protein